MIKEMPFCHFFILASFIFNFIDHFKPWKQINCMTYSQKNKRLFNYRAYARSTYFRISYLTVNQVGPYT